MKKEERKERTTRERWIDSSLQAMKERILRSKTERRRRNDDGKPREILVFAR